VRPGRRIPKRKRRLRRGSRRFRDGWVTSKTLDVRLKGSDSTSEGAKLFIDDQKEPSNRKAI